MDFLELLAQLGISPNRFINIIRKVHFLTGRPEESIVKSLERVLNRLAEKEGYKFNHLSLFDDEALLELGGTYDFVVLKALKKHVEYPRPK